MIDQIIVIASARREDIEKVPVAAMLEQTVEAAIKTQRAIAGVKSNIEKWNQVKLRKRFKYGSQNWQRILPIDEYCAPGNHVSIMRIKHKSVYIEIIPAKSLKIENIKPPFV